MSDITPEKVAAAVCDTIGGWRHSLQAALSLAAQDSVLNLEVTRWAEDGTETVRHFRAVVVEGEQPLTEPRPEEGPSDASAGRPPLTEAEELRAEAERLKVRLEAAEYAMQQALAEAEHSKAADWLNRYFTAAQAEQERAR